MLCYYTLNAETFFKILPAKNYNDVYKCVLDGNKKNDLNISTDGILTFDFQSLSIRVNFMKIPRKKVTCQHFSDST